ncbi:MAG: response regulator [Chitinophagaceae bacterium]|nr:MAG: response regulator [Chitinophagaceae bacterium]
MKNTCFTILLFLFSSFFVEAAKEKDRLLKDFKNAETEESRAEALKQILQTAVNTPPEAAIENLTFFAENISRESNPHAYFRLNQEISMQHNKAGDDVKALEILFLLLDETKLSGMEAYRAQVLTDIGFIFYYQNDLNKSLDFFQKSYADKLQRNDTADIPGSLLNIGSVYSRMGAFDSAAYYIERALETYKSGNDSLKIGQTLNNLGVLYRRQGAELDLALAYFNDAISIYKNLGDKRNLGISMVNSGIVLLQMEEFAEAEEYLRSALEIATNEGFPALKKLSLSAMAELYMEKNDFENAFHYQSLLYAFQDSLNLVDQQRQIEELEAKYRFTQHQQEIEIKDLRIRQLVTLSGFFVLLLLLLTFIAFYFRLKKKNREELEAAKSAFYTNIAHEFRTPVSLITAPLEEMMQKETEPGNLDKLRLAHQNAHQLLRLINQLLDIAKLENSKMQVFKSEGDIIIFTEAITDNFKSIAEKRGIQINLKRNIESLYTQFDSDKIEKIVQNLLSNAIKFSPDNSVIEIELDLVNLEDRDYFKCSIKDEGPGIDTEEQKHIFKRFYRTPKSEQANMPGTGIGLALANELTRLQGGELLLESTSGKGSKFTMLLPVEKVNRPTVETEKFDFEEGSEQLVLVAEDNEHLRNYLADLIQSAGFICISSKNGKEAFKIATEKVPDIIISDVMMPLCDGIELLNKLKKNPVTEHIPVILLTAKNSQESRLLGLQSGAYAYLPKPFQIAELMTHLKNLIRFREKLKARYAVNTQPQDERKKSIFENENVFIQKIIELTLENLSNEDFSVEELSSQLALSRTQVHRKIKAITGLSASQLMRNIRLEKAMELLKIHAGNVSEVAYQTGFNSPSYFSKCFQEYFGKSPTKML